MKFELVDTTDWNGVQSSLDDTGDQGGQQSGEVEDSTSQEQSERSPRARLHAFTARLAGYTKGDAARAGESLALLRQRLTAEEARLTGSGHSAPPPPPANFRADVFAASDRQHPPRIA
ncbi:hypothetical protein [Salinactinospora qingdaonensis]|uniref:Uncharacterized protein n=1 Tax=Salinactinospora qingdaonensis TaxID=702744 RepID=A0ABP7GA47_9ACTN